MDVESLMRKIMIDIASGGSTLVPNFSINSLDYSICAAILH